MAFFTYSDIDKHDFKYIRQILAAVDKNIPIQTKSGILHIERYKDIFENVKQFISENKQPKEYIKLCFKEFTTIDKSHFSKRNNVLSCENFAIDRLQDAIYQGLILSGKPITVKLKNRLIKGVVGVSKTEGTPKQDFHLIDENGDPLVHLSHKNGQKPQDFQQWGGITESEILSHEEVQRFIQDCNDVFDGKISPGTCVYQKIHDRHLQLMQIYGVNYLSKNVDSNRVDAVLQGDPGLEHISDETFRLTAGSHINFRGETLRGGYEPVLCVLYKGDRSQFGIMGARFQIYPFGGRKMTNIGDIRK